MDGVHLNYCRILVFSLLEDLICFYFECSGLKIKKIGANVYGTGQDDRLPYHCPQTSPNQSASKQFVCSKGWDWRCPQFLQRKKISGARLSETWNFHSLHKLILFHSSIIGTNCAVTLCSRIAWTRSNHLQSITYISCHCAKKQNQQNPYICSC